jgi:hypothetical protein
LPDYRVPLWQCTHETPYEDPYDDAEEDTTGVYASNVRY